MKKETKSASNVIITVSVFVICAAAVLWRWFGVNDFDNPVQLQAVRDSLYQEKRQLQFNRKVYLPAIRLANDGDIVVRLGTDLTSRMLSRFNLTDPSYSHAGMISRENDTVFVYHALGGETNPNQTIIREPLWAFGLPKSNEALGLYRFGIDTIIQKKAVSIIQEFYRQGLPFDTAFNLATKDRMYCTELITCCFEKASGDKEIFHRSTTNGKVYIAVDDITENQQVQKVGAWRY